jgi:hypothetical protein
MTGMTETMVVTVPATDIVPEAIRLPARDFAIPIVGMETTTPHEGMTGATETTIVTVPATDIVPEIIHLPAGDVRDPHEERKYRDSDHKRIDVKKCCACMLS